MDAKEEVLKTFTTRVRQLMLSYKELKDENAALQKQVSVRDEEISGLKQRVERLSRDYDLLKTARMMQITDGDVEEARKRLNKLIRNVNKSLALLNGQV
jgi:predicted nuclease with TOPRIM domain